MLDLQSQDGALLSHLISRLSLTSSTPHHVSAHVFRGLISRLISSHVFEASSYVLEAPSHVYDAVLLTFFCASLAARSIRLPAV